MIYGRIMRAGLLTSANVSSLSCDQQIYNCTLFSIDSDGITTMVDVFNFHAFTLVAKQTQKVKLIIFISFL